jgi:hypothetical protein
MIDNYVFFCNFCCTKKAYLVGHSKAHKRQHTIFDEICYYMII